MGTMDIKVDVNVAIPMRDGTLLRADIYRPNSGEPAPTLVIRTPYDKWTNTMGLFADPLRLARNGYAVVIQDCRGCSASDGEFFPFRNDAQDGYDTIEWAAGQPWSNARVGMYGVSYLGVTQWMTAREQPPHLVAIAPMIAGTSVRKPFYMGGVFQLQMIQYWSLLMATLAARKHLSGAELLELVQDALDAMDHADRERSHLPLNSWPFARKSKLIDFYFDFLKHPENDAFWRDMEECDFEKTLVPAYVIAGWHDCTTEWGAIDGYSQLKARGGSEKARRHTRLTVGPWVHSAYQVQKNGDIDFGARAAAATTDQVGSLMRWFDYWLKGIDNGVLDEPPVRLFVMGDNVWRDEHEWPLARTQYTPFYLQRNAPGDAGLLSTDLPGNQGPDQYDYDPKNPVPTCGGSVLSITSVGPVDQSAIGDRQDVLTFMTPPLALDTEITGPISVVLYAQSSAPDTDFTAKLVDVYPTGEAYILADGIIRARYRNGDDAPVFIEPGQVYQYTIDLHATSNVFKAGHRIRVDISSSNFPKFDRNLNTGKSIGDSVEMQIAHQQIFHDHARPSHIVLPVIPR